MSRDGKVPRAPSGARGSTSARHVTLATARTIRPPPVDWKIEGGAHEAHLSSPLPSPSVRTKDTPVSPPMPSPSARTKDTPVSSPMPSPSAQLQNKLPSKSKAPTKKEKHEEENPFAAQTVAGIYQGMTKEVDTLKKMLSSVYDESKPSKGQEDKDQHDEDHEHEDDHTHVDINDAYTSQAASPEEPVAHKSPLFDLSHMVKHGYSRIEALFKELQPDQRLELMAGVDLWIGRKLPQCRRLDAELDKRLGKSHESEEEHAKWDIDDTAVTKHMESFYDKLEDTMRSHGLLAKDKQRLQDARSRAGKLTRRSSIEQQKLQEIQDEVKEIRDELIGMDASVDENVQEVREKKRQFDELSEKVATLKGDVEVLTRKLVGSKEQCRLLKLALEQVTASGDCKSSSDLVLDEEALEVVKKAIERLRGNGADRIREKRPDIQIAEAEAETVEVAIQAYESKVDFLNNEHGLALKKMVTAGIDDPSCMLEAESVYRERAQTFNHEIDDVCFKSDCLERKLETLEESIGNMTESAEAMEEAQPLFWSNIAEAIQNLLREDEDAMLGNFNSQQVGEDPSDKLDLAMQKKRLDDKWNAESTRILSMFANFAKGSAQSKRASSPGFFTSEDFGFHDIGSTGGVQAGKEAPVAKSLEASCVDIWTRIDKMRETVHPKNKNGLRSFHLFTHSMDKQGKRLKMLKGDFWQLAEKQTIDKVAEFARLRKLQSDSRSLAGDVKLLTEEYQSARDRQAKAREAGQVFHDLRHFAIDSDFSDLKEKVMHPRNVFQEDEYANTSSNIKSLDFMATLAQENDGSDEMQKGFANITEKLIAKAKAKASSAGDPLRGQVEKLQLNSKDLARQFGALKRGAVKVVPATERKEEPPSASGAITFS